MTGAVAESVLGGIKNRFFASLDERLAEIETLFHLIGECDDPSVVFKEIGLRAHRISGVAATLGYERLGQAAALVDQSVLDIIAGPGNESLQSTFDAIEALLDELDRIMESGSN